MDDLKTIKIEGLDDDDVEEIVKDIGAVSEDFFAMDVGFNVSSTSVSSETGAISKILWDSNYLHILRSNDGWRVINPNSDQDFIDFDTAEDAVTYVATYVRNSIFNAILEEN